MPQQTETIEPQEPPSQPGFFPEADEEPPGKYAQYIPSSDRQIFPSPVILPFPFHHRSSASGREAGNRFRRKFYPGVSSKQWNDWHWQVANRIRTVERLQSMLLLTPEERQAAQIGETKLPMAVTPYYLSLIPPNDPDHPLRRAVVPTVHEFFTGPGEGDDPLGEESQSPVPGLVHRYPDRVLFLVHDFCSTYCRYCTRSRVVGHGKVRPEKARFERMLEYIRSNHAIRDVILSGGDPLLLSDDRIEWLLNKLRLIPHVEVIRIGTKIPAVLPQRITSRLVRIIKRYHPVWMSLHFMHPDECTDESRKACAMLADGGIPLGSQTVLLKGINDNVETMKQLMQNLMKMRVRPYYLYQCDPISGSAHFRTPVAKGLEIISGLRGYISGYAVPTYVIDAPGGGGKIPLMPDAVIGRSGDDLMLRNYQRNCYRYPDVV
jgi:lysine 2,3-aminomutase